MYPDLSGEMRNLNPACNGGGFLLSLILMRKLLLLFFGIFISSIHYSQVQDTTLSSKYANDICSDNSKKDYQKSVDYFIEITKKDPADLEAYYNLGMSYYKLLEFNKAVATYDQLIERNPCFNYALHNRALCKFFLKDKEGACIDFKKALQCDYRDMSGTKKEYEKICK